MQGKLIIIITFVVLSGCSVAKKASIAEPDPKILDYIGLKDMLISSNITAKDFDIARAEIEICNNGENRKLISSIKYRLPGNYLISVRHRSGMEAARIYISNDTIMVNDRIYRNLYLGSNVYLLEKYGLETGVIPLIFGDYLDNMKDAETIRDCRNGISEIQGYLDSREIWYFLDCNKGKVTSVTISDPVGTSGVNMNFSEFRKSGNSLFPGRITVEDVTGKNKIIIDLSSVEYKDSEKIEFIPGRNYKKIILK